MGLVDGAMVGTTVGCASSAFVPEKYVGADDGTGVCDVVGPDEGLHVEAFEGSGVGMPASKRGDTSGDTEGARGGFAVG